MLGCSSGMFVDEERCSRMLIDLDIVLVFVYNTFNKACGLLLEKRNSPLNKERLKTVYYQRILVAG